MNAHVLCGEFVRSVGLKTKGLRWWSVTPCLYWLRGLDLNQRPLGYEGNGGGDDAISPTNWPHRKLEVVARPVGLGWGWLAGIHGQNTDSSVASPA